MIESIFAIQSNPIQSNETQRTNNIVDVFEEVIVIDCNRSTSRERERERERGTGSVSLAQQQQHQQDDRGGDRAAIERLRSCAARSLPLATHRRGARSLSRGSLTHSHSPTTTSCLARDHSHTLFISLCCWLGGWQQQVGAARGLPDTALCL